MSCSSDLLRIRLAQRLYCERNQIINSGACGGGGTGGTGTTGPTGPTGPAGDTGPQGPAGNLKSFTFYLDWSASNSLSRIYVPPGFSTTVPAGIYTANQGTNLVFVGTSDITITGTDTFPTDMSCTGYTNSEYWTPMQQGLIGASNGPTWQNTQDNKLILKGVTAQALNGGNLGNVVPRPVSGVLAGWLGTLTIYYL
jgi:hypothetical protein